MNQLLICCLLVILLRKIDCSEDEFRLLKDLRENYDPVERPAQNHSEPVIVQLKILLQQIVDVDEKNQVLTVVLWFQTLLNHQNTFSADQNFDARFPVNFVVHHTGEVLHAPPAIVKCSCEIDITWFPFDEQICFLKYGTWTYSRSYVDLVLDETDLSPNQSMDMTYYIKNGEWTLISTDYLKNNTMFEDDEYSEHFFYIIIRRRTIYYGMNWIVPSILFYTSNVLGFTLPPECGEKITLQITNLLSITVFLGMVAEVTPPTSESVPLIAAFFALSMITLGAEIIFTILIINMHFRSAKTHKMGRLVRLILLEWLPWTILMDRPEHRFKKPYARLLSSEDKVIPSPKASPYLRRSDASASRMVQKQSASSLVHRNGAAAALRCISYEPRNGINRNYQTDQETDSQDSNDSFTMEVRDTLHELREFLRESKRKMTEDEEEEEAKEDWHFAAMVLDRFCLYFFTVVCGGFIMIVFL
uniref:Uncharacterized protein n=1 Tax=Acrobeloides nanus TaxID=290746 RepID=A0A914EHZ5_9BILA